MNKQNFTIAEWHVKPSHNLLINKGVEVRVEPKVMALLVFLANANGDVVSREVLLSALWDQVVQDDALTNTIAHLRKALVDNKAPRRYIDTIPKQGYRLIPKVEWQAESLTALEEQESSGDKAISSRRYWLVFAISACLLFIFLFFNYSNGSFSNSTQQDSNVALLSNQQSEAASKTVAVLPFDVYSSQEDVKFFADGLTEELIHQLAANPNLSVISRTSSATFQGTNTDIKKISKLLGARYIIEGSIRQSDETLRITVQLIDSNKDIHIWSKTFDNHIKDSVLETQSRISEKISMLITNKSTPNTQKRNHPQSTQAYRLFLLAQSHLRLNTVEHYEKALNYYLEAVDLAPDYALAYAGMAKAHLLLYQYKHTSLEKTNIDVSQLLAKAFSLDPDLADTYAVRGLLNTYLQEFSLAEKDFKKALELNSGLEFALHNYGFMLWRLSRAKEALVHFDKALQISPLSTTTNFAVGDTLTNLGEIDKAIEHFKHCQKLLPDHFSCFLGLANLYNLLGDSKNHAFYLQKSAALIAENNLYQTSSRASYEFQMGNIEAALLLVKRALAQTKESYYVLKLDFNLKLQSSKLDEFEQHIKNLSLQNPNSLDLNLLLGLTSYYQSNCQLAITHYEKARKEKGSAQIEVWDFAEGISHELNLAYCYQQRNNQTAANNILDTYQLSIRNLPTSSYNIPGRVYNYARYLALTKQPDKAKSELKKIESWSYIWLLDYDPVLKSLLFHGK